MIVIIAILVVLVDQLSKFFFLNNISLNQSIPVIKNLFHFTLVYNTGIAFGILKGSSNLILIVTVAGLALIGYSLKKDFLGDKHSLAKKELLIRKIAIGFILGGAIGNMIDRLRFGYVIDFIDLRVWPVFNLADSFITIGAVILFWKLFINSVKNKT
ncbi:MAG: signal peptidase II [Candidatus Omnitrophica bacterium]|nr:signal peptidase II [Candidatus Omnitrophota bacterium]